MLNSNKNDIKAALKGFLTETSIFDQLNQHAGLVCTTINALAGEIRKFSELEHTDGDVVSESENKADQKKHQIRTSLPRSDLLMPVARSDLLSLLMHQDEVADAAQDVAELLPLLTFEERPPEEYREAMGGLASLLEQTTEKYENLSRGAGKIIKGTTRGPDKLEEVQNSIEEVNEMEHKADIITREAVQSIYSTDLMSGIEKYHSIQIALMVSEIFDNIERATNYLKIMIS